MHEISRGCMFFGTSATVFVLFVSKASPFWQNKQKVYYHKSKPRMPIKGAVWHSDLTALLPSYSTNDEISIRLPSGSAT